MPVKQIIEARETDLDGINIRRVLPYRKQRMVGPWIFFDHIGPIVFHAGEGINVKPHPHINLATVTYLFEGEILHRDSLGNKITIKPGDINLMVAGRGITHSEREREAVRSIEHALHALQLWHVLPEQFEEMEPEFHHVASAAIPKQDVNGVPVRVMMGSAYGMTSPVKTCCDIVYAEAELKGGQELVIPVAEEIAIYVVSGNIRVANTEVKAYSMLVLDRETAAVMIALTDTRITIIGGEKPGERYIDWNFVSSRKERIQQAIDDWQNDGFDRVVDDEEEFTAYPG